MAITLPLAPVSFNEQHHKDACAYSVEIAKQFITMASAGIAFVVGVAIAAEGRYRGWFIAALVLLGLSLFIGIGYIMNIVGAIHVGNDYDVYSPRLRWVATIQMLLFLFALVVLGKLVLYSVKSDVPAVPAGVTTTIDIVANGRTTKYELPAGRTVVVTSKPNGEITLAVAPSK
jgi:hypothetical protein